MSEHPRLVPGAPRRRNHYGPSNSLPTAHVDLGRTHQLRRSTSRAGLHIVVREGETWLTLCRRAKAVKSYRGRPDQAGCHDCKREVLRATGSSAT